MLGLVLGVEAGGQAEIVSFASSRASSIESTGGDGDERHEQLVPEQAVVGGRSAATVGATK